MDKPTSLNEYMETHNLEEPEALPLWEQELIDYQRERKVER